MKRESNMKKPSVFFGLLPFVVFFIALAIGATYENHFFYGLALASLSIIFAGKGAGAIIKRKSVETDTESHRIIATYKGISAIMNGLYWLFVSILLFISAIPVAFGQGQWLAAQLTENPGIFMITLGLIAVILGIRNLIGSEEVKWSCLRMISGRISGLVMLVLGIILIPGGLIKIASPELFDQTFAFMKSEWYRLLCQENIFCRNE